MPDRERRTVWAYADTYNYPRQTTYSIVDNPYPVAPTSPYPDDLENTTSWLYDNWPGAYVAPGGVTEPPTAIHTLTATVTGGNELTGSWTYQKSDAVADQVIIELQADDETEWTPVSPELVNLFTLTYGPIGLRNDRTYQVRARSCYATVCTTPVLASASTDPLPAADVVAVGIRVEGGSAGFGALIQPGATLQLTSYGNYTGYFETRIYGVLEVNPDTFSADPGKKPSDRPKTTNYVTWSMGDVWVPEGQYRTPDLQVVLQEIVNQVGYTTPQMIAFVFEPVSGTRAFWGHDDAEAVGEDDYKPILAYTYAPALLEDQLVLASPLVQHEGSYVMHNGSYVRAL